uniref:Zinc finger protein 469-like isoform X3 n=1 Tax=Dermatophagoides pteronyssinus TaxID=6956 RepID=A0A6P6XX17_DERPT|nr:zinc finger protein 469-like isoform X3 [Dermatophagoides pteronyssinus]
MSEEEGTKNSNEDKKQPRIQRTTVSRTEMQKLRERARSRSLLNTSASERTPERGLSRPSVLERMIPKEPPMSRLQRYRMSKKMGTDSQGSDSGSPDDSGIGNGMSDGFDLKYAYPRTQRNLIKTIEIEYLPPGGRDSESATTTIVKRPFFMVGEDKSLEERIAKLPKIGEKIQEEYQTEKNYLITRRNITEEGMWVEEVTRNTIITKIQITELVSKKFIKMDRDEARRLMERELADREAAVPKVVSPKLERPYAELLEQRQAAAAATSHELLPEGPITVGREPSLGLPVQPSREPEPVTEGISSLDAASAGLGREPSSREPSVTDGVTGLEREPTARAPTDLMGAISAQGREPSAFGREPTFREPDATVGGGMIAPGIEGGSPDTMKDQRDKNQQYPSDLMGAISAQGREPSAFGREPTSREPDATIGGGVIAPGMESPSGALQDGTLIDPTKREASMFPVPTVTALDAESKGELGREPSAREPSGLGAGVSAPGMGKDFEIEIEIRKKRDTADITGPKMEESGISREPSAREPSGLIGELSTPGMESGINREPSAREPSGLVGGISAPTLTDGLGREPSAREPSQLVGGISAPGMEASGISREQSAPSPSQLVGGQSADGAGREFDIDIEIRRKKEDYGVDQESMMGKDITGGVSTPEMLSPSALGREPTAQQFGSERGMQTSELEASGINREPSAREPSGLMGGPSAPGMDASGISREPSAREPSQLAGGISAPGMDASGISREPSAREASGLMDGPSTPGIEASGLGREASGISREPSAQPSGAIVGEPSSLASGVSVTGREPSGVPSPATSTSLIEPGIEPYTVRGSSLLVPTQDGVYPPMRREFEPQVTYRPPVDRFVEQIGQVASQVAAQTRQPVTITFRPTIVIIQNFVSLPLDVLKARQAASGNEQIVNVQNQEVFIYPNSINITNLSATYSHNIQSSEPFLNFTDSSTNSTQTENRQQSENQLSQQPSQQ